jgi:hypothetical protein
MEKTESIMKCRHLEWKRCDTWILEAVLLERRLLNGAPQLQTICRLAAINQERAVTPLEHFQRDWRRRGCIRSTSSASPSSAPRAS